VFKGVRDFLVVVDNRVYEKVQHPGRSNVSVVLFLPATARFLERACRASVEHQDVVISYEHRELSRL